MGKRIYSFLVSIAIVIALFIPSESLALNVTSEALDNTYISSNSKEDFIKAEVQEDKLNIEGATLTEHKYIWIQIKNSDDKVVVDEHVNISNKKFNTITSLPREEGQYTFNVYYGFDRYGRHSGVYYDIPMLFKDGRMSFPKSVVYKHNKDIMNKNNNVKKSDLDLSEFNSKDKKVLKSLAEDITKGIDSDYEKAFEISKWVSLNIYYNWDGYKTGNYGETDAIGVLNGKKSVCQGYAELNRALMRSIGIPAKLISGHSIYLRDGVKVWDEVNHNDSNHAWNEVFVDGRWIIIDATWNSRNKYENGKFEKGDIRYRYFDPTIEAFSLDHKILNRE